MTEFSVLDLVPVRQGGTVAEALNNAAELAAHDLWAWGQAMSGAITTVDGVNTGGLISPRGCIVFTPAASKTRSGILNVLLQWRGLTETYDAVQGSEAVCGTGDAM